MSVDVWLLATIMAAMARHLLYATGSNSGGQLSLGHSDDVHRLARVVHQPPHPGPCTSHLQAFPPPGWTVEHLASGANHSVAILGRISRRDDNDKHLWLCGESSQGQLGQALYDARRHATMAFLRCESVVSPHLIACGWDTTYVASRSSDAQTDQQLFSWGTTNDFGQLGVLTSDLGRAEHLVDFSSALERLPDRIKEGRGAARIQSIAASPRHVLFSLYFDVRRGGEEMEPVRRGTRSRRPPRAHCLVGFGASRHGQLGSRNVAAKVVREPTLLGAWLEDDVWLMDGVMQEGRERKLRIAVGKEHSAYLVPDSWVEVPIEGESGAARQLHLHVLGSNKKGQLDVASHLLSRVRQGQAKLVIDDVQCTWNATLVACRSDEEQGEAMGLRIFGSGKDDAGQLGLELGSAVEEHGGLRETDLSSLHLSPASQARLICGSEHVLFLSTSSKSCTSLSTREEATTLTAAAAKNLYGWGWNEHGNLSTGDEVDSRQPVLLWPSQALGNEEDEVGLGRALKAWAGCGTTFLLVETDT